MDPKISVIFPVYNVEAFLEKSLDSIINQTFKDLEIICINDGSTDNSLMILEKFAKKDSRIILINQENKGLGASRNIGITLAKGEYISFIDSDDYIENNMYEIMYKKAVEKDADIVECDFYMIIEGKRKKRTLFNNLRTLWKFPILFGCKFSWRNIKSSIFTRMRSMVWNRIYKKEMLLKNNVVFPESRMEDFPFSIDALLSANSIVHCNKILYNYLIRKASLSFNPQTDKRFDLDHAAFIKNVLLKHNLYNKFEKDFLKFAFSYYGGSYLYEENILLNKYSEYFNEKDLKDFKKYIARARKFGRINIWKNLFCVKSNIVDGKKQKEIIILGSHFFIN